MGEDGRRSLAVIISSLLLLLGSSSSSSSAQGIDETTRVLSAERRIDLTSSIVRVFLTLKLENAGSFDTSEILLAFSPTEADRLALLKASVVVEAETEGKQQQQRKKKKKTTYAPLQLQVRPDNTLNGAHLYSASLPSPLKPGATTLMEVLYVLTHSLEPFPAEIAQSESQLVYYRDSATLLSPYHVVEQTTLIKAPSNKIESYTRVDPTHRAGVELRYGPYHDRTPYSFSPVTVHFENNNPFAVVEELVREVEISHWGNVQVTEHYTLKHAGARHNGVFSRLEYQSRPSINGASSFKHLLAKLPPHVHSVYYRDEIGNISSSHLRTGAHKSELEIEPRYPLFGGWKATFVIGYGLPLQDFLFESLDGKRFLNFSFGCPLVETVVEELTIKVVLPEGSKNPLAKVSFPVEEHLETSYSYLDVVGRTTLVLKKKNVVPEHNVLFQVYYNFSPIFMLSEPLMLVFVFFLFFIACIAYLHMDLSIGKS